MFYSVRKNCAQYKSTLGVSVSIIAKMNGFVKFIIILFIALFIGDVIYIKINTSNSILPPPETNWGSEEVDDGRIIPFQISVPDEVT